MFSEVKEPYRHVQDIGVRWAKLTSDIYWSKVQPTKEHVVKGLYDWFLFDMLCGRLPSGVNNDDDPFYPIFLRQLKDFYFPLLKNLSDKNIYPGIFDVHYYSGDLRWPSNEWNDNWEGMKDIYRIIRQNLDLNGFKNTEIWFTETATMEKIDGEKAQAASLVKRYVYPLSFGVKKISGGI